MTEIIMRRMKWKTAICIWMKCSPKLNVTGVDPTQETADFRKTQLLSTLPGKESI